MTREGQTMKRRNISVVIPVYNSALSLGQLAQSLSTELAVISEFWEVILVDDGSNDASWNHICLLAEDNPCIKGVRLGRNYGQQAATLAGIRLSKYQTTITMDDDLQHRPSTIQNLVAELSEEIQLVYGISEAEEHSFFRNWTSRTSKWFLSSIIGMKQAANASAFRAFNTNLREGWVAVSDPFISIDVLLSWTARNYTKVTVPMDKRLEGSSNYSFSKLVRHFLNIAFGFSTRPLWAITFVGLFTGALGLATLLGLIFKYFIVHNHVAGFTFLASLISFLGGIQLIGIGIIGQYLGRVHIRSMNQPIYTIQSITGQK